jgi:hypothetical protein
MEVIIDEKASVEMVARDLVPTIRKSRRKPGAV